MRIPKSAPTMNPASTSPRKCFPLNILLTPMSIAHIITNMAKCLYLSDLSLRNPMSAHNANPNAFAAWA